MATVQRNTRFHRFSWAAMIMTFCFLAFYVLINVPAAVAQDQPELRATKLMDHPVVNSKGMELAEIDNLILRRSGKVKRVILSCCGFLGLGEKRVAVPFRRLQFKDNRIVFDITDKAFTQLPQFNYEEQDLETGYYSRRPSMAHMGRWGRWGDWGGPPYPLPRYGYPGYYPPYYPSYGPPRANNEGQCPWKWAYSPDRMLVSLLLHRPVINAECERIGFVEDLMIGPKGRVKAMILHPTIPHHKKDRVSVPFQPLETTHWGLVYHIGIKALRDLPEFHYAENQ
jgi:sporulation protein YlmC with PRC-barrel domain